MWCRSSTIREPGCDALMHVLPLWARRNGGLGWRNRTGHWRLGSLAVLQGCYGACSKGSSSAAWNVPVWSGGVPPGMGLMGWCCESAGCGLGPAGHSPAIWHVLPGMIDGHAGMVARGRGQCTPAQLWLLAGAPGDGVTQAQAQMLWTRSRQSRVVWWTRVVVDAGCEGVV